VQVNVRRAEALTTETVQGYLKDLTKLLGADPVRGRLLKKHLGSIVMTPSVDGTGRFYTANTKFDLRTVVSLKTIDPALTAEDRVSVESSCGGLPRGLDTVIRLPWETALVA
jgi:hypothetical protein